MLQPLSVSVRMDAESFRNFAAFDLLRHHKRWHRPALFTAILLVSAGICLSQVGRRDGAALLTVVLAVVALGLPAAYFWNFFHNLSVQIKKMGLDKQSRPFYRLLLDDAGLSVWMAGEQDRPEPTHQYPWQNIHTVYRTPGAIYIYVQQNQAYLLNESMDTAWSFLTSVLPAERLRDCR